MKHYISLMIVFLLIVPVGLSVGHAQNISQVEGLKRVGPIDPLNGYPLWYEDYTGLRLGLCDNPDFCFLELPDPGLPLLFPMEPNNPANNFPDEVFYYAAEAIMFGNDTGHRAILVNAIEGAFFNEAVVNGDQLVFARVRVRIDNLLPETEYTVSTPYFVHTFTTEEDAGPGVVKGPGFSMTRDIGITVPKAFEGPLDGDIGPFLVPTVYNGTDAFISDGGLTDETVTGSPIEKNFFRIEGPSVGDPYPVELWCQDEGLGPDPVAANDCVETYNFSIMGKIADKFGAKIDRATYTKTSEGTYVNVWASTVEGQEMVVAIDGGGQTTMTEGANGNYFARIQAPADGIPQNVTVSNVSDQPVFSTTADIIDEISITLMEYTVGVGGGLMVTTQSSNQVENSNVTVTMVSGQEMPQTFMLTPSGNGLATGFYDTNGGEQPAVTVTVSTALGGSAESNVVVSGESTSGKAFSNLIANAGPDRVVDISNGPQIVTLTSTHSLGPIISYFWTHDQPGTDVILSDTSAANPSFTTPTTVEDGKLTVNFTLTVSDGTSSDSDVMKVEIIKPALLPVDTCSLIEARYRVNKEKWIIEGTCDIAENQKIEIFYGNDAAIGELIGTAWVQANIPVHGVVMNLFSYAPGNGSAATNGTAPAFDPEQKDPKTPTNSMQNRIWLRSSRGFEGHFPYRIN